MVWYFELDLKVTRWSMTRELWMWRSITATSSTVRTARVATGHTSAGRSTTTIRGNEPSWQRVWNLVSAATTTGTILSDGFQFHSHAQTLIKPTSWALLACGYSDRASGSPEANIILPILDSPFKETLTAFTRENTIMKARNFITTNWAWAAEKRNKLGVQFK